MENTSAPKSKLLLIVGIVLVIVSIGFVWLLGNYMMVKKELAFVTTPEGLEQIATQEVQELVKKVGKLIVLPTDEEPSVATIVDADLLAKEQVFYQNASSGDKILIYVQAKKAIIYNPEKNILVNVGPIYLEDNPNGETSELSAEETEEVVLPEVETITVEVRNGSDTPGAASTLVSRLADNSNFNFLQAVNSSREDYEGTTIVDLTNGTKNDLLAELKGSIDNAVVVSGLPEGEANTLADVVVIVGR